MGFFGTYLFDGSRWAEVDPESVPVIAEPWLFLDIHDSDVATVAYAPGGSGSGVAYLGFTPRTYFEIATASEPTDTVREAAALVAWRARIAGAKASARPLPTPEAIQRFLAIDDPPFDPDAEDDGDLDDADVFVERRAVIFLQALDLPLPDGLAGFAGAEES